MAAPAPLPHRSLSPPSLAPNARPSSSSPAPSAYKKEQDVAAGRRRYEVFLKNKQKKTGTGKPQKTSGGKTTDLSAPNVIEDAQQSAATRPSQQPNTSETSNGHVSTENREDGINGDSKHSPSTELALVPVPDRQQTGSVPSSDAEIRLLEAEQDFDSKIYSSGISSSAVNATRGLSIQETDQRNISSSERIGDSFRQDAAERNMFGMPTASLGASGPLVYPAHKPPSVSQHLGTPISVSGHDKTELSRTLPVVRPSPFAQSFSSSQGFQNGSFSTNQRPVGASLVQLDNKLFSNRTERQEARPPSSMEPEQELISSAGSMGTLVPVSTTEWMTSDRHPGGNTSSEGITSLFPNNAESWRAPNPEMLNGPFSSVVNNTFSTLPPPSRIESFAPVRPPFSDAPDPKYLPFPPPRSHPPLYSSLPHMSKSEPSLPPNINNASESGSSSYTSIQAPPTTTSVFGSTSLLPTQSYTTPFAATSSSNSTIYENGILEPTSTVNLSTQTMRVGEPGDRFWQPPPPKPAQDDFLEQHIEDLTQEKYSLQRGLDAARALAETLAQENSALTEDYNKQGALVNELKEETERHNEEMRAQVAVVKNMRSERDKALQEGQAAVGRAQALAAEVIALEEKVLRSRSQELKLQREMETLAADTDSYRRQIASLEKDRANLRSLVEALQEEKALLQTRLRMAASFQDMRLATHDAYETATSGSNANSKSDAWTSTGDLELEVFLTAGTAVLPPSSHISLEPAQLAGFPSFQQQHEQPAIMPAVQTMPLLSPTCVSHHSDSSSSHTTARGSSIQPSTGLMGIGGRSLPRSLGTSIIPSDHVAIVENINILISELAEEKEALLKTLRAESVGASELRALNAELSHKLEVQTQRLELAVAQSMAHGSTQPMESAYETSRMGAIYVDEGDEVVDRVLGWIMQLFPSGSSRRKRL